MKLDEASDLLARAELLTHDAGKIRVAGIIHRARLILQFKADAADETYKAMCQRCGEPRADGRHGLGHCVVSDAEVPAEVTIYERGGYVSPSPAAMLGEALERARLVREAFDMLPLESKVVAVEAGAEHWRETEARKTSVPDVG